MASQFARGNYEKRCRYCGSFVPDMRFVVCRSCGTANQYRRDNYR